MDVWACVESILVSRHWWNLGNTLNGPRGKEFYKKSFFCSHELIFLKKKLQWEKTYFYSSCLCVFESVIYFLS